MMIVCIRMRRLLAGGLICFLLAFGTVFWQGSMAVRPVFSPQDGAVLTVIVDPGHGGEDGGAVSPGGIEESHINLAIATQVNDLLCFSGLKTHMTRTEDVSIHSADASSAREKKVSDIHHRVDIVNGTPNAILLSIHQNSLPSSTVTHGAQAFFNEQEGAQTLAGVVQEAPNNAVNTERPKKAKAIPPAIYLMKKSLAPAVLVECGFLSNQQETVLLQESTYQRKLAVAITAGFLRGIAGEEAK